MSSTPKPDVSDEENEEEEEDEIDLDNIEDEDEEDEDVENGEIDDEDKDIMDDEQPDEDNDKDELCYSKYIIQENSDDEEDDEIEEISEEEDIPDKNISRQTFARMTNYERIRIIATRARQLQLGAKSMMMIKLDPGETDKGFYKKIAEMELEKNLLPIIIERPLPNGTTEEWNANQLLRL